MSNQSRHRPSAGGSTADPLTFTPVVLRPRADGWTPERQVDFVRTLAATGCVEEAARSVGMSARSARDLRTRSDADSLRIAWDAAMATGIGRLAEAAVSRAIHGTATPIFYKGEQVGERRRFDERLTAFLLRYHAPDRYGAWRDKVEMRRGHPDGAMLLFHQAITRLGSDCVADQVGLPRKKHDMLIMEEDPLDPAAQARREAAEEREQQRRSREDDEAFERELAAYDAKRRDNTGTGDGGSSVVPASSAADGSSASSQEGNTF